VCGTGRDSDSLCTNGALRCRFKQPAPSPRVDLISLPAIRVSQDLPRAFTGRKEEPRRTGLGVSHFARLPRLEGELKAAITAVGWAETLDIDRVRQIRSQKK